MHRVIPSSQKCNALKGGEGVARLTCGGVDVKKSKHFTVDMSAWDTPLRDSSCGKVRSMLKLAKHRITAPRPQARPQSFDAWEARTIDIRAGAQQLCLHFDRAYVSAYSASLCSPSTFNESTLRGLEYPLDELDKESEPPIDKQSRKRARPSVCAVLYHLPNLLQCRLDAFLFVSLSS
jgi:hypothetical protein